MYIGGVLWNAYIGGVLECVNRWSVVECVHWCTLVERCGMCKKSSINMYTNVIYMQYVHYSL